jgi:hypothetical protein
MNLTPFFSVTSRNVDGGRAFNQKRGHLNLTPFCGDAAIFPGCSKALADYGAPRNNFSEGNQAERHPTYRATHMRT